VDVCDGLLFCHGGCGGAFGGEVLLHRDLKPDNILLRRDHGTGEIVAALGDFGISKLQPAGGGHTTTARLMGTLG
jgi:serine/threonine protein kinase